ITGERTRVRRHRRLSLCARPTDEDRRRDPTTHAPKSADDPFPVARAFQVHADHACGRFLDETLEQLAGGDVDTVADGDHARVAQTARCAGSNDVATEPAAL